MADRISFDVSLSLNCTDLYNEEEVLRNWTLTSRFWKITFQILEVRFQSVHSASLFIHWKWLLHHQKVTRRFTPVNSRNILNIGKTHKHTVQTQIRLLHLISVCTIIYFAFF